MPRVLVTTATLAIALWSMCLPVAAREQSRDSRVFAGGLFGVSTLSADARVWTTASGAALSVLRFSSTEAGPSTAQGINPPAGTIASTRIGLRSHVGIDIRRARRIGFRYSFSETISSNPVSPFLTPPAPRRLANFQNLFAFGGPV